MNRRVTTMSFAASLNYIPPHPERTAKRDSGFDVTFQEWTSRGAMLETIRMQGKRAPRSNDWRPVQP